MSETRGCHARGLKLRVQGRHLVSYLRREFPRELERVRYVKLDTEGFDRAVAGSLRELLVANRPHIRTEIFRFMPEAESRGYWDDLRKLGYRLHRVESEEELVGVPVTDAAAMTRWEYYDHFGIPQ